MQIFPPVISKMLFYGWFVWLELKAKPTHYFLVILPFKSLTQS